MHLKNICFAIQPLTQISLICVKGQNKHLQCFRRKVVTHVCYSCSLRTHPTDSIRTVLREGERASHFDNQIVNCEY